jgi:hypothetical protein
VDSSVDITFSCLPLRSVGRLDVPLDASGIYRARHQRLQAALHKYGAERTYYLYDARCIFRLTNSEIEGMVRFDFEGIVRTDASDALTDEVELDVRLTSETCGDIPPEVETWLKQRVEKAVAIEFDRFIAAGQLSSRTSELGDIEQLSDLGGFSV